jgi:hypothetical protein
MKHTHDDSRAQKRNRLAAAERRRKTKLRRYQRQCARRHGQRLDE